MAFPKLAGELIDVAINSQQPSGSSPEAAQRRTNVILFQIIAVVVLGGVAGGLRSWLFQSAAERVMYRLRVRLFKSLVNQEVGFYDRVRTGESVCGREQAALLSCMHGKTGCKTPWYFMCLDPAWRDCGCHAVLPPGLQRLPSPARLEVHVAFLPHYTACYVVFFFRVPI